jgi:glycosyltransferase involved in cell wall biosynthesis
MKNWENIKILICNFESLNTPSGVASFAIKLLRHIPFMKALTTRNFFKTPLEEKEVNLEAKTRFNEVVWINSAGIARMNRKIRDSDLIHLNPFNFTELIFLFLAKIHGKKCIATMHSNINSHYLTPVIALEMVRLIIVYNVILLMTDRIVFLSRAHLENYLKYSLMKKRFKDRATIIPNAIETEKILPERNPVPEDPLTCIFVGRFERRKGIYDLLKLAELLKEEPIRFMIVGFGHLHANKQFKNVTMIGKIDNKDIFDYYDKSHILLMPSYSEAFGITILEAMARGLVILASDIPGMREKIEPGKNGFLFPAGDINKMKEHLLFLKENPKEINRISRNNIENVQRFTVDKQAKKYIDLYCDVLLHD